MISLVKVLFAVLLVVKIIINDKKFSPIDTVEKITIADSFVVSVNKLGTAHGESKLYIGNKNQELWNF